MATKHEVVAHLLWVKEQLDSLGQNLNVPEGHFDWDELLVAIRTTMMNEDSIALVRDNLRDFERFQ
jgi:hypothetical protein